MNCRMHSINFSRHSTNAEVKRHKSQFICGHIDASHLCLLEIHFRFHLLLYRIENINYPDSTCAKCKIYSEWS